jgi:predicted nucleic acid-binding protein
MIVIDSSFILAYVLPDERNPVVVNLFENLINLVDDAIAPNFLFYEIHNALIQAVKRKRIEKRFIHEYIEIFQLLPISYVNTGKPKDIIELAFSYELTFYDAAFLELAIRRNITLATLDRKLHRAAIHENVAYSKKNLRHS